MATWPSSSWRGTALTTHQAYFGRYEVNDSEKTVTHHVQGSLTPNALGSAQVRQFTFSGNRLTLRPPVRIVDGKPVSAVLVWERVG